MALAGIDTGTVSWMAAGHEVGDRADGWGPFISEREMRSGGSGRGQAELGHDLLGWLAREEGRDEEKGWATATGREEGGEKKEPMKLLLFPMSFSISYLYMHMFK